MTIEEIKSQLEELIKDRESFMVGDYDKDIYDRDKEALEFAVKAVEKAARKGVIKANTCSRKKSALDKALNKIK